MSTIAASLANSDDSLRDECVTIDVAFERCATSLYRFFAVRLGDPHVADDLMQQLWLAARKAVNVPAAELEFWLRATARNLLRTHWRRTARRPDAAALVDPALAEELAERIGDAPLPDDVISRREVRDQLLLAITTLPHEHQELIVLHYFESQSQRDIAAALRVGQRAIEGRLYRARAALRDALRHLEL